MCQCECVRRFFHRKPDPSYFQLFTLLSIFKSSTPTVPYMFNLYQLLWATSSYSPFCAFLESCSILTNCTNNTNCTNSTHCTGWLPTVPTVEHFEVLFYMFHKNTNSMCSTNCTNCSSSTNFSSRFTTVPAFLYVPTVP